MTDRFYFLTDGGAGGG